MEEKRELLDDVQRFASDYRQAKIDYDNLRESLDKAIRRAQLGGASFREISHYSGFSIGHTQKALERQGYVPKTVDIVVDQEV